MSTRHYAYEMSRLHVQDVTTNPNLQAKVVQTWVDELKELDFDMQLTGTYLATQHTRFNLYLKRALTDSRNDVVAPRDTDYCL